jgi:hexosaminidase
VGAKKTEDLQAWMNGHFAKYLAKKGKRPIWWGEIPEGEIPADLAVMSWLGPECGVAAAKKGHEVVMCPHKSLYFDYTPCVPEDPCKYPYFTEKLPAAKVYAYDPLAGIPPEYHKYVLGGEGCNWTEYTYSQWDLDWKCWTRAAAMAEVFWTAPKVRDLKEFMPRLRAHVGHLKELGVNCAPVE